MQQFTIFLCYSSISICLLFQLLLFGRKNIDLRAISLFFILLNFQAVFAIFLLLHNGNVHIVEPYIHWLGLELFSLGPLTYMYIRDTYEEKKSEPVRYILHYIPLLIFLILAITHSIIALDKWRIMSLWVIGALHLMAYMLWNLRYLRITGKTLKEKYADLRKKDLRWFMTFVVGLLALIILEGLMNLTSITVLFPDRTTVATILVYSLFTWYFTYHAFNQKKVPVTKLIDYKAIRLTHHTTDEELMGLRKKLDSLFNDEEVYLDEELSLKKVSDKLGVSEKYLSYFFNTILKTTFYDFVNDHRVDEVIKQMKLEENRKFTLLALAYKSGFKSKATFNRIFKKTTGSTPSQYLKSSTEITKSS